VVQPFIDVPLRCLHLECSSVVDFTLPNSPKAVNQSTVQFVLLYLLKVLFGGQSMNELPQVLFSNIALMELVGFNVRRVEEGLTKRGDTQRKSKKKQGPLSPQCLADNISKLSREQMERLFNQMVQCVVRWGLLDGQRIVALDGSKLETPKTYEGCSKLKQTRIVKVKGQKERATEEYYVYGWKVLVLMDVHTRLPLSMKVVKIEELGRALAGAPLGASPAQFGHTWAHPQHCH